ncbi:hypothetical protein PSPO01_08904 [Paraphaeosphaeria sporulosa]
MERETEIRVGCGAGLRKSDQRERRKEHDSRFKAHRSIYTLQPTLNNDFPELALCDRPTHTTLQQERLSLLEIATEARSSQYATAPPISSERSRARAGCSFQGSASPPYCSQARSPPGIVDFLIQHSPPPSQPCSNPALALALSLPICNTPHAPSTPARTTPQSTLLSNIYANEPHKRTLSHRLATAAQHSTDLTRTGCSRASTVVANVRANIHVAVPTNRTLRKHTRSGLARLNWIKAPLRPRAPEKGTDKCLCKAAAEGLRWEESWKRLGIVGQGECGHERSGADKEEMGTQDGTLRIRQQVVCLIEMVKRMTW